MASGSWTVHTCGMRSRRKEHECASRQADRPSWCSFFFGTRQAPAARGGAKARQVTTAFAGCVSMIKVANGSG